MTILTILWPYLLYSIRISSDSNVQTFRQHFPTQLPPEYHEFWFTEKFNSQFAWKIGSTLWVGHTIEHEHSASIIAVGSFLRFYRSEYAERTHNVHLYKYAISRQLSTLLSIAWNAYRSVHLADCNRDVTAYSICTNSSTNMSDYN